MCAILWNFAILVVCQSVTIAIIPTTANTAIVSKLLDAGTAEINSGATEISSGVGALISSAVGALSYSVGIACAIFPVNIIVFQTILPDASILYQSIEQLFYLLERVKYIQRG